MLAKSVERQGGRRGRRKEAARYAGISIRFLDQLVAKGQIPVARIGRAVVIDFDDIDEFIRCRKQPVAV